VRYARPAGISARKPKANRFAIEILAPKSLIEPVLSSDPDLRDAQRLRDRLDVSLEAGLRRMIEIREEPLAAIWSTNGRVRYSVNRPGFTGGCFVQSLGYFIKVVQV